MTYNDVTPDSSGDDKMSILSPTPPPPLATRSTLKSIIIVATCTFAMIVNVCLSGHDLTHFRLLIHITECKQHISINISIQYRTRPFDSGGRAAVVGVSVFPQFSESLFNPSFLWRSNRWSIQGCLLLMFGRLADLYGRKKTFLIGSFTLAAFTLGCSFSQGARIRRPKRIFLSEPLFLS